ncbi:MAG: phosphate signaling complex protein PhoU [Natronomonas sp.]|jgi:phosphate transport system protein|uniref:Phosphate-specific transport system accessory protein PhoU n=1 Tax=Natronomonas salsuginis TaxID=2217661 RepID=A0A4V5ZP47_9EURY|nr:MULTISPECIES: phosphate signaling complex protein PhoU [Natronomonas]MDR9382212.1 phosphate signaling complex protein PhoU [Natronomonas sp.]MDR9431507.1 phosphate signaling complex protein PhoU [Natronomonas sp.]TKR27643.1 phosphate signaling complex protein PhoU [Natronomonas salsuginis]
MTRSEYQQQLSALRRNVVSMSDLVIDRYDTALRALETKNESLAGEVIDGDGDVNHQYLDIEGDCIDLFALQQPVAGDLRFIAASFKIVTDLERIGDLATNLAGYALDAERERYPEIDLAHIGHETGRMVAEAMAAYERDDSALALEVADRDDEIDRLCTEASELVVEDLLRTEYGGEKADVMDDVSRLLLTVRDLERVGDHAVNICARTVYMTDHDTGLIY